MERHLEFNRIKMIKSCLFRINSVDVDGKQMLKIDDYVSTMREPVSRCPGKPEMTYNSFLLAEVKTTLM